MKIIVDKRTELMGIVLMLSKYLETYPFLKNTEAHKAYNQEILNTFGKFKEHDFIKLTNQMIDKFDFNYDAPFAIVLQNYNANLELVKNTMQNEYTKITNTKIGKLFLQGLPAFAKEIEFDAFFLKKQPFYSACIQFQETYMSSYALENFYKQFFGIAQCPEVVCNLFLANSSSGGFGLHTLTHLQPTLSVQFSTQTQEQYPCPATFVLHEMCHPFVNKLTDEHVSNQPKVFKAQSAHYTTLKSVINDYIIRAIELLFLEKQNTSTTILQKRLTMNKEKGFPFIDKVLELLHTYDQNRDTYPTFSCFYPTLLNHILSFCNQ